MAEQNGIHSEQSKQFAPVGELARLKPLHIRARRRAKEYLKHIVPGLIGISAAVTNLVMSSMASAQTPSPFTEEAVLRGVDYKNGQWSAAGLGVCFADLDNDGDPDLITTGRSDGLVGIFRNKGDGHFDDLSVGCGVPPLMIASSVTAADYDGDGDLDLFFTQTALPNVLMRNDGDFQFTDVSAAAEVDDGGAGKGAAWGDYNNDGWIDLYVPNRTLTFKTINRDILYLNKGDGTFEDVSIANGLGLTNSAGHQAVFLDYDRDGDCDLYLSNDGMSFGCVPGAGWLNGWLNQFHENVGGGYVNVTNLTGTGACINSMGVAVGDLDGNGYPDLYATNTPDGNVLYLNNGDKTFTDASAQAGVQMFGVGWGANFFDYNNDGVMDLYVCDMVGPNPLYVGQSSWPMIDMGVQLGVGDTGQSFCSAVADVDGDGDLDIVMTNQESGIETNVRLYINHEGEKRNWMKLRIVGSGMNTFAVGAQADVRVGQTHYYREVYAGSSWKSQDDTVLHIGLGDGPATVENQSNGGSATGPTIGQKTVLDAPNAIMVDEVTVLWPGGETRTLSNLSSQVKWTIYPDERLGDVDGDLVADRSDFLFFVKCYGKAVSPGCEMMDFDGDGTIDDADFSLFLNRFAGHWSTDCDANGVIDMQDILNNPAADSDGDGILDICQGSSTPDLTGDGVVNSADLAILLSQWGGPGFGDLTGDGVVDSGDLAILLSNWG